MSYPFLLITYCVCAFRLRKREELTIQTNVLCHRTPPVHEKVWVFGVQNPELSLHSGVPARRCVFLTPISFVGHQNEPVRGIPFINCPTIFLVVFKYMSSTLIKRWVFRLLRYEPARCAPVSTSPCILPVASGMGSKCLPIGFHAYLHLLQPV